jgi:nucleoid-associated protein YgaU
MRILSIVSLGLAGIILLLASACERGDNTPFPAEADDPNFRQGQQLERQGRTQEALSFYLKAISRRGESAPESHLEAGLIYLQSIKDPLAAIYHFRKYLELQPNAKQAVYVRGLVDTAKREFARTLPAQPLESQAERLEMLDQVDRLRRENDQLKAELASVHGGVSSPTITTRAPIDFNSPPPASRPTPATSDESKPFFSTPSSAANEPAPTTASSGDDAESPVSLVPDTERERATAAAPTPSRTVATSPQPQPPTRPTLSKPTPPSASNAASGHRHVVQRGDTLFSLAQKYYGNRSRWRDIYAANRDQLPAENALRPGMELRIP